MTVCLQYGGFPRDVEDGVGESVQAKSELKDHWREAIELFGSQKGDKRSVVCLDHDGLAQDVV